MSNPSIRQVIDARLLTAVFQPIVAAGSMALLGYEGLIRGPANSELATPAALFAAARACGQGQELELCCLRTVCTHFAALALPGKLFLNVGAGTLLAQKLVQRALLQALDDVDIDPRRVVLEITEEQGITDFRRLRRICLLLNRQGFSLAIDDLGAGFASLRMWLEMRPAFVKIDIAFIRGVQRDLIKQAFVRAIHDIACACGTRVIAEGIETAEELDIVRGFSIDYGQGFYIARPAARPDPLNLLAMCHVAGCD